MNLQINNLTRKNIDEYRDSYLELLKTTLEIVEYRKNVSLSVVFVSTNKIRDINNKYRNINKATDVISFAYLDDKTEVINVDDDIYDIDIGEIYICYDVAKKNAIKYGNSLNRELNFLFVHGLLHLLGYNHIKKEDEKIMLGLQEKILPSKEVL